MRESSDVAAAAVNDNETKRNQIKGAAARVAPGDLYCLQRRAGLSGVSGIVVVGTVTNPADGAYQIPSHSVAVSPTLSPADGREYNNISASNRGKDLSSILDER